VKEPIDAQDLAYLSLTAWGGMRTVDVDTLRSIDIKIQKHDCVKNTPRW
jgi:hypothetical protein